MNRYESQVKGNRHPGEARLYIVILIVLPVRVTSFVVSLSMA